jgi:translocation and assembly module TamB
LGLETKGRDVALEVSSRGLTALMVRAAGHLEGDNALALGAVSLEYPGTVWATESGSRLSWENGIDLQPLELRSGGQSIVLELHKPPGRLSAKATLSNLDVSKLPTAFVPEKLGLAGSLSGTATAEGTTGPPKLSAVVDLKGGKVRTLTDLDAHAEAVVDGGRSKGTLRASVKKATVEGNFDFPLKLGKAPPDTPLNLALQVDALPFSEIFTLAGQTEAPLVGTLRVGATLQGTIGEPRLALDASTLGAVIQQQQGRAEVPIHSAAVRVETGPAGNPIVDVEVSTLGGTLKVGATTSQKLEALMWRPPDAKRARELDWTANATLDGLALAAARPLLPAALIRFDGTVQLDAHALGPVNAPAVQAHLVLSDFTSPDFKPILVKADFDGGPSRLQLEASAEAKGKQLLVVRAQSDLSFTEVMTNTIDASKTLGLTAQVGPMDLTEVAALRGDTQSQMTGLVHASLEASGTLGSPRAKLRAELEKLKLQKTALGKALLEWNYDASQNAVQLWAQSTNGGQLQAKAKVGLDLGLAALKKKDFSVLNAPVQATLASRGFELSFLSGVHAALRTVGGYLTADAKLDGKLGAPALDGKVTWNKGRLGIAGMSELKDIELEVLGNNDTVVLKKLDAKSGAGTASVKGEARRAPGASQWAVTGKLEADKLPLVTDDQLRCIIDVRASLEGDISPLLWNLRRVEIPEAHVQLPVVKKKNTQGLDRPGDIVLVRDGVAVGPRPKRWKKKADAALAAAKQKERVIRVGIAAPRNLWLRGTDVNLEVGLSDDFTLEYDHQLYLNGEVKVMRGKVEVLGRKFELQRDSSVRFQGIPTAPALNVTAAYTNDKEKVTVYATLVGQGEDFTFHTTSKPALSDTEIYTLLATGRRQLRSGSGGSALSAEQGLSVLGAVVASQLKSALTEKMPIELFDVLEISAGGEGFKGARLEAGKYIGDRLYIGYVGQVGADQRKGENANAGRIEYQFAPGWSVQGTVGDAPAGSAELVWGIEF